ncbi:MAG TPA: DNA polymerase/3'-5' exonuclease PolX [Solirubrobacteraceae bacterium]|jgi:DNA polymerase (family 10)|nr:DNA polymerase/3'-5' exonuclease PolX [Solirubrobacteraceae bacterium]
MAATELQNSVIADALDELADLNELDGAIVHRVLAYRNAARRVRESPVSVASLAQAGKATELPGIGATIQEKIVALQQTGTIPALVRLRERFPPELLAIMRLPGIGAKRARLLHDQLGVDSPEALRQAALDQRVRGVKGLGPKFEQTVLEALAADTSVQAKRRVTLPAALQIAQEIAEELVALGPSDAQVEIAGSIRRTVDAVKDIDLVAVTSQPQQLREAVEGLERIEAVSSSSPTGVRGRSHAGLAIDLRIAAPDQLGNLLQHFTGSGAHNAALREAAVRKGLHVSEYGVEDERSGRTLRCADEQAVYEALGLAWIPPELREDRGELAAAALDGGPGLPGLVTEHDIRGDLHCHTTASDGQASIQEMAAAAIQRGYGYLAITDHSASHGFGNDVSPDELRRQIERVRECNAQLDGIELLAGSEVNVLGDGSLDYEDDLLEQLDWVVASVHTSFAMGREQMTKRMVSAIEHPLVDAIGHPTGRLIERREPYALDLDEVFEAAARTGTLLEINGNPDRRDLPDTAARTAAAMGVRLVIDSDAHRVGTLANVRWGVATARRAWLTKNDVANTLEWPQLRALRKTRRVSHQP